MRSPCSWPLSAASSSISLTTPSQTEGALDTELTDVDRDDGDRAPPSRSPSRRARAGRRPAVLARIRRRPAAVARAAAGDARPPGRKHLWTRGLGSYIEYPPSYCEGTLYVNAFEGEVFAIDAQTGKIRWRRDFGGTKPSTPAIDGPAPHRELPGRHGHGTRPRARPAVVARVDVGQGESSPVVVDGLVYFGVTDGRLYAVDSATGRVRWAYATGGRINSSPSVYGPASASPRTRARSSA